MEILIFPQYHSARPHNGSLEPFFLDAVLIGVCCYLQKMHEEDIALSQLLFLHWEVFK